MGSLAYERGRTLRIDGYRRLGASRLDGLGARSAPSASCAEAHWRTKCAVSILRKGARIGSLAHEVRHIPHPLRKGARVARRGDVEGVAAYGRSP